MIIPTLELPLHIIGVIALGWLAFFVVLWYLTDLRYYGIEGFYARKCRKKNIPLNINVDIGSGNAIMYPAEKTKKGAGRIYHKGDQGAKIDPAISMGNDEPIRLPRGLDLNIYGTMDAWPTSVKNAAGIEKIKEIRQKPEYQAISRIPDKELMELLDTPEDHLPHDLKLFIERYKIPNPDLTPEQVKANNARLESVAKSPEYKMVNWMSREDLAAILSSDASEVPAVLEQMIAKYYHGNLDDIPKEFRDIALQQLDTLKQNPAFSAIAPPIISIDSMLDIFNELKCEVTEAPIDPKFKAFRSALKDNPNAFKTTDVTTLENILRQMITEDMMKLINWMQYGIIIMGIIGVTGVIIAVVLTVSK